MKDCSLLEVLENSVDEKYFNLSERNKSKIINEDGSIYIKEKTLKGFSEVTNGDSINLDFLNSSNPRGIVKKQISGTILTKNNIAVMVNNKIRKLTPLESFRVQSFPDEWYYELKQNSFSDTQLYKLAGNSVSVNVAYFLAKKL